MEKGHGVSFAYAHVLFLCADRWSKQSTGKKKDFLDVLERIGLN